MSDWKVDPDHRKRLLQLQKVGDNKKCVDCHAPNPQWASPKFGVFICLECAGVHRSLGVHISFVRSITMDQFKDDELVRMEKGGNEKFVTYMRDHGFTNLDSLTQQLKYDNVIAEDYKNKLTCDVEGKPFEEPEHPGFDPLKLGQSVDASANLDNPDTISRSDSNGTPLENRRSMTPKISGATSAKEKNEAYFEELGKQNQNRPDHLPPSQGGKYQGFGSTPINNSNNTNSNNNNNNNASSSAGNTLSLDNLQNDPVGTLSRGWSLFSSAITKSVSDVNESVIKPGYQQWQSGELSEETKRAATQFGQKFQETSNYGYEAFNNFTKNLQEQYYNHENGHANAKGNATNPNAIQNTNASVTKTADSSKTKEDVEDEWDDF